MDMALFDVLPEGAEINDVSQDIQYPGRDLNQWTARYKALHEGSSLQLACAADHSWFCARPWRDRFESVFWYYKGTGYWHAGCWMRFSAAKRLAPSSNFTWIFGYSFHAPEMRYDPSLLQQGNRFLQNIGTSLLWRHILEDCVTLE